MFGPWVLIKRADGKWIVRNRHTRGTCSHGPHSSAQSARACQRKCNAEERDVRDWGGA